MHHDNLYLVLAIIRSLIWFVGLGCAWWQRRAIAAVAFGLGGITALVLGLSNANYAVSAWLLEITTYLSPLVPGLVVAAFILGMRRHGRYDHWKMF